MRFYADDTTSPLLRSLLIDEDSGDQRLAAAMGIEDFDECVDLEAAAAAPDADRNIPFIMFSENPMRTGDIVRVKGYDLAPWGKTGMPFLDSHEPGVMNVLGHMRDVEKATTKAGAPAVKGWAVFADGPPESKPSVAFGLYRAGHMKAGSIAIRFREWKMREFAKDAKPDPNDNADMYMMPPLDIARSSALEFSAVSVGRHTEALVTKAGLVAGVSDSDVEAALVEICRGVVGYNGGARLERDQARLLAQATLRYIVEQAAGPKPPEAPATTSQPPEDARRPLTAVSAYRNLDPDEFALLLRAVPDRVMRDLGIGGRTR